MLYSFKQNKKKLNLKKGDLIEIIYRHYHGKGRHETDTCIFIETRKLNEQVEIACVFSIIENCLVEVPLYLITKKIS